MMLSKKNYIPILGFLALALLSQKLFGMDYYTYSDEEGTTYFSDEPPMEENIVYEKRRMEPDYRIRSAVQKLSRTELRELIQTYAEEFKIDASLVEAVVKAESAYNPMAVSKKGARGLMQLMPKTAKSLGVENSHDPRENLRGGIQHLKRLVERYEGDLSLALAAYNAGEGAVSRYNGIPPYAETTDYVRKVKKYYDGFKDRAIRTAENHAVTRIEMLAP